MKTLFTQEELQNTKHENGVFFHCAALVVFDMIKWQSENGYNEIWQSYIDRYCPRFKLGEWVCALLPHYPIK